jgi:hypothetical protein
VLIIAPKENDGDDDDEIAMQFPLIVFFPSMSMLN